MLRALKKVICQGEYFPGDILPGDIPEDDPIVAAGFAEVIEAEPEAGGAEAEVGPPEEDVKPAPRPRRKPKQS